MSDDENSLDAPQPELTPTHPKFGDAKSARQLQLIGVKEHHAERFSGPIPPPEMLEQYNNIIPNAADRILVMAEQQQKHRQEIEKTVILGGARRAWLGLILGFVLALTGLIGSMFLIWSGRDVSGITLLIASLGGLIGVFVYQTRERKNERLARSSTRSEQATAKATGSKS